MQKAPADCRIDRCTTLRGTSKRKNKISTTYKAALTQMQTTKSRYLTLSILGARREQIKRSINQQVLWYFLLPLILACISGAVGIYAMQLYLYSGAEHLEQSYPLLIAMAVIVVLVMVIYGVAVARTANREIGKLNYKPNS